MKKSYLFIALLLSLSFVGINSLAQSSSSEKTKAELKEEKKTRKKATKAEKKAQSEEARKASRDYARFTSLADILRQQTGVIVTGAGANVRIQIRGINSIELDTRPLFVYDGIQLGRDYMQANNAVDRATIKSVRVLRSLDEVNFYGERVRNGVIVIKSMK